MWQNTQMWITMHIEIMQHFTNSFSRNKIGNINNRYTIYHLTIYWIKKPQKLGYPE